MPEPLGLASSVNSTHIQPERRSGCITHAVMLGRGFDYGRVYVFVHVGLVISRRAFEPLP